MPSFNYQSAKQAGYNDNEIAQFLQQQKSSGIDIWIDKNEYQPQEQQKSSGIDKNEYQPQEQQKNIIGQGLQAVASPISTLAKLPQTREVVTGALKTIPNVIKGGFGLVEQGLGKLGVNIPQEQKASQMPWLQKISTPTNPLQQAGFIGGEIAQFLLPTPLEKYKGAGLLPRITTEAVEAGAKTALQQGEIGHDTKVNALIAAAFPITGATIKSIAPSVAPFLKSAGEKIQKVLIKASASDKEAGFKIENLAKNNIGGSLGQMATQVNTKLSNTWNKLKDELQNVPSTVQIGLKKVYQKTINILQKEQPQKMFGSNVAINRVLGDLGEEIKIATNGTMKANLLDSTTIKQGAGTKGAWTYGFADKDAPAIDKVYTTFYNVLKIEIENVGRRAGISNIDILNKTMSELIPINSAIIRRMPVEERKQILGLTDNIHLLGALFNPKALALYGVDKLLRSGNFANFLIKASNIVKKLPSQTGGAITSRVLGGDFNKIGKIRKLP